MDYYNAMDQPYKTSSPNDTYISDVGIGLNPMQHQTESLKARIFEGASQAEFIFMGKGKGSSQQFTPESFGRQERQDMRDLAELNKITTTTHASPNLGPLSGFSQRGFNDEQREGDLKEIKKAIDFAANASSGGAVVFHTGEWQRPISESFGKEGLKGYPDEDKRASILLADKRTGEFVTDIRKDELLYEPEYKTNDEGEWIDLNGKVINPDDPPERLFQRVPVWNPERTNFKIRAVKWDEFEKRADSWNEKHPNNQKTAAEMFARTKMENQILQAKGSSLFYAQRYEREKEERDKAKKALELFKQIEETTDEKEKWKLLRRAHTYGAFGDLIDQVVPSDLKMPTEHLKRVVKEQEDSMRQIHEATSAADAQAQQLIEKLDNLETLEEVGISRTADTIGRAGVFAFEKSKDHPELKKPLFVAPEAYDPKFYGSHPDEIRKIVTQSRKKMAEVLTGPRYNYSEEEAKKAAKEHIKATFDIAHMNTWRQHFERNPGESMEHLDKRFNKWLVGEAKKLAKDGILGHVHVSDNFGFDDEHLTPGEGNAPIKEFLEEMKKAGLKSFILETGSFNPTTALTDTWAFLGSPIYSVARPGLPDSWTQIQHSYFGRTNVPYHIVGEFGRTISEDYVGSPFWSGLPLE